MEKLIDEAKKTAKMAYAPYSKYHVGAAAEDEHGNVFTGCNIENASFGATMCAERTAIFKAISEGGSKIKRIAVAAERSMPYPCGMCRQVMLEFMEPDGEVIVECDGKFEKFTISQLVPYGFETFDTI